jgi:hypothetical protein
MGVVVACGPLIEAAAPSLMPAMDIGNSSDRFTFWELWDVRLPKAPTVAKYATTPDGVFHAAKVGTPGGIVDVFGIQTLDEFLSVLRGIEAAG